MRENSRVDYNRGKEIDMSGEVGEELVYKSPKI